MNKSSAVCNSYAHSKALKESLSALNPVLWLSKALCQTGTRTHILELIESWRTSTGSQVFWLYGQAGSGKSTIAQTIFQTLQTNGVPSALYTCSKTQADLHNPLNVLPTLCYQLCMANPIYGQYIANEVLNSPLYKSGFGHINTQLEILFLIPIQKALLTGAVFLILDALDECGSEADQGLLVGTLFQIVAQYTNIKILVTCHNNFLVKEYSQQGFPIIDYQLNPANSLDDVSLYFKHHIPILVQQSFLKSHPNLIQLLTEYSKGLFIWAQTLYNYLKSNDNPEEVLCHILQHHVIGAEGQTQHLHQLYHTILADSISDNNENITIYQYVFGTILLTGEPVTKKTIANLLKPEISVNSVQKTIQSLNSLVIIDETGKIHILHPSLADYLLDTANSISLFHINKEKIHFLLYQKLISILNSQLKPNICNLETSSVLNAQIVDLDKKILRYIPNELQYASQYWIYHLTESGSYSIKCKSTLSLILVNLVTVSWIECLSLLGKINVVLGHIQTFQAWLKVRV